MFLMKTQNGEVPNTNIFQAIAPLERPRGIEIFEKCSEFRDPQIQEVRKLAGFGVRGTEIGFDRLCRGLKIDFLPSGTLKSPPNRSKP